MTNKRRDMLCSVIMLIFGVAMLILSVGIPHKIPTDVGSGYVPKFIAICIIVASTAKLILSAKDKSTDASKIEKIFDDVKGGVGTIALMLVYLLIFQPVGTIVSSTLYLFLQMLLLSDKTNRKPLLFALISIAVPVAVDALFVFVIKMPLPKGIIGF